MDVNQRDISRDQFQDKLKGDKFKGAQSDRTYDQTKETSKRQEEQQQKKPLKTDESVSRSMR